MTFADWHSAVPDDQRTAGQSQWVNNYSECTVKEAWPQARHSKAWAAHGTADKWTTATAASPVCVIWKESGQRTFKVLPFFCTIAGAQRPWERVGMWVWSEATLGRNLKIIWPLCSYSDIFSYYNWWMRLGKKKEPTVIMMSVVCVIL